MSDSGSDGQPEMAGLLWGNIGEQPDYLGEVDVSTLQAVSTRVGLGDFLKEAQDAGGPSDAAAAAGSAGAGRASAAEEIDEPTLPEDLEDDEFPILRPAPAPAAAAAARGAHLAASGYNRQVAGEDDYDEDEDAGPAAAAAARPLPAQQQFLQQQPSAAALAQQLGGPTAAVLQQRAVALQQLQQYQLSGMPLSAEQLQHVQQLQQVLGLSAPAAAAAAGMGATAQPEYAATQQQQQQQVAVRRPKLTPEQERMRALNLPTPDQEEQQQRLMFRYLDLDQLGEDIVHFSELYVPSDSQIKHYCLSAFARAHQGDKRQQHELPGERARQRADALLNKHYQQRVLQQAGPDAGVADDEAEKFHKGEVALAATEGNVVALGLANMRQEVLEELSEPEDELFASDPQGLGATMLQARRMNAARAAAQAAVAALKAKAAAADAAAAGAAGAEAGEDDDAPAAAGAGVSAAAAAAGDAAAAQRLQGITAGLQGLGLQQGLAANPYALDTLQAHILPDWEHEVEWGSVAAPAAAAPPAVAASAFGPASMLGAGTGPDIGGHLQQQQQQFPSLSQGSLALPGLQQSLQLPGMSGGMSGLPSLSQPLGLPPGPSGLPGAPSSALGLPGGSLLQLGSSQQDPLGQQLPGLVGGSSQLGLQDAAAAAALSIPEHAAAAAAAAAAGVQGRGAGRGKHGRGAGALLGKPRKPLDAALADLRLNKHMLRLAPPIATAAGAPTQPVDAAAAVVMAAAASGDRAAAAALPQGLGGPHEAAGAAGGGAGDAGDAGAQLKLRHVGELLQVDMKPVLPDDDDWLNDVVWDAQDAAAAAGAAGTGDRGAEISTGQQQQQQALVAGLGGAAGSRAAVLWDLNDPNMVFEVPSTQPYANASAIMHPVPPQAVAQPPPHLLAEKDALLRQLAPLHISRDYLYTAQDRSSSRVTGTGKHSTVALAFSTIPVFPKDALTPFWHRPKSWWASAHLLWHLEGQRLKVPQAPSEATPYVVNPIGLNLRKGLTATVDHGDAALREFWQVISRSRAYKDAVAVEAPRLRGYGPGFNWDASDDSWMGCWLDNFDSTVPELGFKRGTNYVVPVWSLVSPLKTQEVGALLPSNVPCRPPAAFKTVKSLSAAQPGHVLLLEYLEERPMMMLQPGMGVRLTTYYRRKNDTDMYYQALHTEYTAGLNDRQALPLTSGDRFEARPPWMVGTPQLLTPDDPSPFYELAPIPPGEMQYAVDTPCFRAPAAPHVAPSADFLLVRLAGGNIALREITGCVTVGQQHPSVPVWAPMSAEAVAYERTRFKAFVVRLLRTRSEHQAVKQGKKLPMVSMQELQDAFRSMSIGDSADSIARMLSEFGCAPVADQPGYWTYAPGAKHPSEQELRKELSPDNAVQYEALLAGIGQRDYLGLPAGTVLEIHRLLEATGAPPVTTLRLVLDMLFPDTAGKQAATAIEQCVLNPPWAQSSAYLSALRDSRQTAPLTLTGRADPTGRGRGFAYTREDPKKAKEEAAPPPGVKAQADGTITGTDADLRRLGHKRAGELLMNKFGMDPDAVTALPRWDRIDAIRRAVRDPANAAIVNADPELRQYVRNVKLSAEDMKAKMRHTAAPIFAAQMNALHEPWDDDAVSDELGFGPAPKLAHAEAVDEEVSSALKTVAEAEVALSTAQASGDPSAIAAATAALQQAQEWANQPRTHGLCTGMPGMIDLKATQRGTTGAGRGPLAGERRIRRVITYTTANSTRVDRVLYINSRDDINALNALYKSGDNFGERKVVTLKQGKGQKSGREVKLGEAWDDVWYGGVSAMPDLPPDPVPDKTAAEAAALAAAAAAGAAGGALPSADWVDYGDPTGATAAAAAAGGYGGYGGYDAGQDMQAWQQQQQVAAVPAAPRAAKMSKKQLQQLQKQQAAKARREAARKGKKRRRRDDFGSDDDSFEITDSEDVDEDLAMLAEGSSDERDDAGEDGGSPAARTKRARPTRAAAAAAAAAATPAVAGVAAAAGAELYVPPADVGVGAMEGASPRMVQCLDELQVCLRKAYQAMQRHQANRRHMQGIADLFMHPVTPGQVADYAQCVPPERQMWLQRINERLSRNYYGSSAQFLADADMIVQAAEAYHTPGRGAAPNIRIPPLARETVRRGRAVLEADMRNMMYWDGRVQIEAARQQGTFKQALQAALDQQHVMDLEAVGWHWIQCDACQQWRLVSGACYYEGRYHEPDTSFRCSDNTDRTDPPASCSDPKESHT